MKNRSLYFLTVTLLCCCNLVAQDIQQPAVSGNTSTSVETISQITANDYCEFLNETASRDELHFYDGKMVGNLGSACIVRSGTPGSYSYQGTNYRLQATGSEKNAASPMLFLSYNDLIEYCTWENRTDPHSSSLQPVVSSLCVDQELKSNILTFCIASSGVAAHEASGVVLAGLSLADEEFIGLALLFFGGVANADDLSEITQEQTSELAGEESMRFPPSAPLANQNELTREHFRQALERYPDAGRFVIVEKNGVSSIEPQEADPAALLRRGRSDNFDIVKALRNVIPPGIADDLLASNQNRINRGMSINVGVSLSASILQEIFERLHLPHAEIITGHQEEPEGHGELAVGELILENGEEELQHALVELIPSAPPVLVADPSASLCSGDISEELLRYSEFPLSAATRLRISQEPAFRSLREREEARAAKAPSAPAAEAIISEVTKIGEESFGHESSSIVQTLAPSEILNSAKLLAYESAEYLEHVKRIMTQHFLKAIHEIDPHGSHLLSINLDEVHLDAAAEMALESDLQATQQKIFQFCDHVQEIAIDVNAPPELKEMAEQFLQEGRLHLTKIKEMKEPSLPFHERSSGLRKIRDELEERVQSLEAKQEDLRQAQEQIAQEAAAEASFKEEVQAVATRINKFIKQAASRINKLGGNKLIGETAQKFNDKAKEHLAQVTKIEFDSPSELKQRREKLNAVNNAIEDNLKIFQRAETGSHELKEEAQRISKKEASKYEKDSDVQKALVYQAALLGKAADALEQSATPVKDESYSNADFRTKWNEEAERRRRNYSYSKVVGEWETKIREKYDQEYNKYWYALPEKEKKQYWMHDFKTWLDKFKNESKEKYIEGLLYKEKKKYFEEWLDETKKTGFKTWNERAYHYRKAAGWLDKAHNFFQVITPSDLPNDYRTAGKALVEAASLLDEAIKKAGSEVVNNRDYSETQKKQSNQVLQLNWHETAQRQYEASQAYEKALQAHREGELELAESWRISAQQQEQEVQLQKKALNNFFKEGENLANIKLGKDQEYYNGDQQRQRSYYYDQQRYWQEAYKSSISITQNFKEASEAEAAGNILLAEVRRDLAALEKQAREFSEKAVKVSAGESPNEKNWNRASNINASIKSIVTQLEQSYAEEVEGRINAAQTRRNLAALYYTAIESFKRAYQDDSKKELNQEFKKVAGGLRQGVFKLEKALNGYQQNQESLEPIKQSRKIIEHYQQAIDFLIKAEEACEQGKWTNLAGYWKDAALGAMHAANNLLEQKKEVAAIYEQSIEPANNAAIACIQSDLKAAQYWNRMASALQKKAEFTRMDCLKRAELCQQSAELALKAVEAHGLNKEKAADYFDRAAAMSVQGATILAEQERQQLIASLKRAAEASMVDNEKATACWDQVVSIQLKNAKLKEMLVQCFGPRYWEWVACESYKKGITEAYDEQNKTQADRKELAPLFIKAAEAYEQNKIEEGDLYYKTTLQLKNTLDGITRIRKGSDPCGFYAEAEKYYNKASQEYVSGKEEIGSFYHQVAQVLYEALPVDRDGRIFLRGIKLRTELSHSMMQARSHGEESKRLIYEEALSKRLGSRFGLLNSPHLDDRAKDQSDRVWDSFNKSLNAKIAGKLEQAALWDKLCELEIKIGAYHADARHGIWYALYGRDDLETTLRLFSERYIGKAGEDFLKNAHNAIQCYDQNKKDLLPESVITILEKALENFGRFIAERGCPGKPAYLHKLMESKTKAEPFMELASLQLQSVGYLNKMDIGRASPLYYEAESRSSALQADQDGRSAVATAWREAALKHHQSFDFFDRKKETFASKESLDNNGPYFPIWTAAKKAFEAAQKLQQEDEAKSEQQKAAQLQSTEI